MRLRARRVAGALLAVLAGLGTMAAAGGSSGAKAAQLGGTGPTPFESSVTGVSCSGASSCLAVGYYTGVTGKQPLAESWDGSVWSAGAPAVPAGGTDVFLLGVSCPAPWSCQAVGHYDDDVSGQEPLAEAWDGSGWTAATPPAPAGATDPVLAAVSCPASTSCEAAGYSTDAAGGFAPLVESDRRHRWTAGTPPLPPGGTEGLLFGVSCRTASSCEAVGQYFTASGDRLPFAESWNGVQWRPSVPPVAAGASGVLYGVSCPRPGRCRASGVYTSDAGVTRPLAESWNGTAWSAQIPPTPPGGRDPVLVGASCRSTSACQSAGSYVDRAGAVEPLAETWHGSTWRATTPPVPDRVTNPALSAVSCPSASLCQAVGAFTAPGDAQRPLAETWRGAGWSESTWPGLPGPPDAALLGVSCPSPSSCLAVGYDIDPKGGYRPLTELRRGRGWTASTPPKPPAASEPTLAAISCAAPDACMAVGFFVGSGVPRPLAEAWNGAGWTAVTPPLPAGGTQGGLDAVSCDGAGHCQAVGYSVGADAVTEPLAETWNGTTWTADTPPLPHGGEHPALAAVSCPAASSCVAAGYYIGRAGAIVPLAEERRDGGWTAASPPSPAGAQAARLYALSCASVSACEAVGEYVNPAGDGRPLAEAWRSGAWTAQTPPTPAGAARPALAGVSCQATGCLAVGGYQVAGDAVPPDRPLAEALRGPAWTRNRVPLPRGAAGSALSAVTCETAGCIAVGADTAPTGAVYPMVATFGP